MTMTREQELIESVIEANRAIAKLKTELRIAIDRIAALEKEDRILRSNLMGLARHLGSLEKLDLG